MTTSIPTRTQRIVLFFDMNSYFASVEQQANPFLRGRAVAVCADTGPWGCILASSKEAKARGIVTGMRVLDAQIIDPAVVLLETHSERYRSVTRQTVGLLQAISDTIETYSIDEAFVDLTGLADWNQALAIGQRLKRDLARELGEWITCSMAIAPTRWLAKFIGDIGPKGGLTVLRKSSELRPWLENRPLTDAWGIGHRLGPRLQALGIHTLLDLQRADPLALKRVFGLYGYLLWANVNGQETGGLTKPAPPKTIGHSHVLAPERRTPAWADRTAWKLLSKTGRRLRAKQMTAQAAYITWETRTGRGGGHIRLADPFQQTEVFARPLRKFLHERLQGDIVSLAVGVYDLAPVSGQQRLWSDHRDQRQQRLHGALDAVWDRYGEFALVPAPLLATSMVAPDRVGFRKTVDRPALVEDWSLEAIDD